MTGQEDRLEALVQIANRTAEQEKSDVVFTATDFTPEEVDEYWRLVEAAMKVRERADQAHITYLATNSSDDYREYLWQEQAAQAAEAIPGLLLTQKRLIKKMSRR